MANAAILGYGTVGSGVYEILKKNSEAIAENALGEEIKVTKILDIRDFPDHEEKEIFTKNFEDILNDDSIKVVAEVMGGLHPAYEFTKALLEAGKSVVTSNKELVATYGTELMGIAVSKNENYMFEASVGGGIPIIRPMHQCLTANKIQRIAGILNGTTNYILNQMIKEGKSFEAALSEAQEKGYAEKNPAADIEGHDACRKIAILASLACGKFVDCKEISTEGITKITSEDVSAASSLGYVIKLIGLAEFDLNDKLYSCVAPMLVDKNKPLAGVDGVFNAITVVGDSVGELMFYGRGAGKLPTASAVTADMVDCVRHPDKSKQLKWEASSESLVKNLGNRSVKYFIRTTASLEDIQKFFKVTESNKGESNGETVVVTDYIKESDAAEAFEKLGNIKSALRLLD